LAIADHQPTYGKKLGTSQLKKKNDVTFDFCISEEVLHREKFLLVWVSIC
jgi:hypothetical protein